MAVLLSVLIAVAFLGIGWAVGRLVRRRAVRIAGCDADKPERVHRLQRLMLIVLAGYLVSFVILTGVGAALAAAARHRHLNAAIPASVAAAGLVAVVTAVIMGGKAIRRAIADVRGTKLKSRGSRRQTLAGVAVGLVWATAVTVGRHFVPAHGSGHVVGVTLVYVGGLLLLTSVVAPLLIVRIATKPLTGDTAQRLTRLAGEAGVRVRGFRVLNGRGQKVANAAQMGTIPGLRYVLLTDYLLENLPSRQVDAVVAHELGHARHHHLLIKLGAIAGVWLVLEAAAAAIGAVAGHGVAALLILPFFIAIPVGIFLTQGLVGIRLEEAADDEAAELVGADELADALQRIGELNDTKRNTGRGWALITQHPGLDTRLRRLRPRAHTAVKTQPAG